MNPLEVAAIGLLGVFGLFTIASIKTASRVTPRNGNKNRHSSADDVVGFSAAAYSHSVSVGDGCGADSGGGGDC
jgi:hypothetical protein